MMHGAAAQLLGWQLPFPPLIVTERADHFMVSVSLPGFASEDISVRLNDRLLTIRARKRVGPRTRRWTLIAHTLPLPTSADPGGLLACFHDEILTLKFSKSASPA